MINNLSDLVAAVKAWWHKPISLERKPEPMTPEEFKKLPDNILNIISRGPSRELKDQYYGELRARIRRGEPVSADERYRLRMHDQINHLNYGLEHPDEFWKE